MTRVLMITPYLPYPPVSGGRMRTYSLLKRLVRDFEITLVCFGRPEEKAFDLQPLHDLCETYIIDRASSPGTRQAAIMTLTSLKPITMRLYNSVDMQLRIQQLLAEKLYDIIHIESFYMMQNIPKACNLPILLAEPAIEYIAWWRHAKVAQPVYQRPGIALEALKMRFYEPRTWKRASVVGVMSVIDGQIVRQTTPGVQTVPTPNGVDVEYFQPGDKAREPATALYMGDYKYFPNTDAIMYFMQEIMPLICKRRPDFTLKLLGKDPPPALIEISKNPDSGLEIMGLVDDTRPYLQKATLFACPLRSGSGTRFKLMEALASGCPVVSTRVGAEGLNATEGEHMLFGDTPQEFADAVFRLLDNPDEAHQMGIAGREWVVQNHAWEHSAKLVADIYNELMR